MPSRLPRNCRENIAPYCNFNQTYNNANKFNTWDKPNDFYFITFDGSALINTDVKSIEKEWEVEKREYILKLSEKIFDGFSISVVQALLTHSTGHAPN